jgi:2-methylaconitate cis-trans-isomerase PrpF
VGPFAVDEGLVKTVEPITSVRVFNTNSQKVLIIHTPVKDGKAVVSGDYHIDGVPGTAAKIGVDMTHCGGTQGKGDVGEIKIGHPSGIMECDAEVEMRDGQVIPKKATYYRTARRIMEGYVYLKPWTLSQDLHI